MEQKVQTEKYINWKIVLAETAVTFINSGIFSLKKNALKKKANKKC